MSAIHSENAFLRVNRLCWIRRVAFVCEIFIFFIKFMQWRSQGGGPRGLSPSRKFFHQLRAPPPKFFQFALFNSKKTFGPPPPKNFCSGQKFFGPPPWKKFLATLLMGIYPSGMFIRYHRVRYGQGSDRFFFKKQKFYQQKTEKQKSGS
jgi:hypothetical protein